ncbi:MAG TPA: hypothetical protein VF865_16800 [Acidobacteriaceae bacterium]
MIFVHLANHHLKDEVFVVAAVFFNALPQNFDCVSRRVEDKRLATRQVDGFDGTIILAELGFVPTVLGGKAFPIIENTAPLSV